LNEFFVFGNDHEARDSASYQKNDFLCGRNKLIMADQIENAGGKGYCLMYFFIGLLLFIAMVTFIYFTNFKDVPL